MEKRHLNGYASFLEQKTQAGADSGFEPVWMPDFLFDFQREMVDWAVRKGRAAIFADCGLGKTPMGLTWASNVVRKTGKPVLYLTPLAVASQTVREAHKFDIDATHSKDGTIAGHIVVANYERLHYFTASDFAGVVCDESSILKSFAGQRRGEITAFMRKVPYRLLQTATAAPNDYIELGTSSEALGYMGHMDMLNRFFKNDLNNSATGRMRGEVIKFRLKGHAEQPFWRWVCSWARAIRKPSDLGFDDAAFVLPPLAEAEHLVEAKMLADGMLFAMPAQGLKEQREERRRTIQERCEQVAELVNNTGEPALIWCHMNDEGDMLEKMIPDAVQVCGSDSDERKEERLEAFAEGRARVLITKPKIGAWGLNFQHCNHVTFFPSHSFEQYYQSVRRCWRFGQKRPVTVDIITTEGERGVMRNLQRKAAQADTMFSHLVAEMNQALHIERANNMTKKMEIPTWL
jgi:SNF2 family DNA or RNA helicase